MADLLQVYLHLGAVVLLEGLRLSLAVEDLQLELLDFGFGVLVVLFDHVPVHLDVVALGFEVVEPILVEGEVLLKIGGGHVRVLVFGLFLPLGSFGRHERSYKYYFRIQREVCLKANPNCGNDQA